jgi:hypothetical protein
MIRPSCIQKQEKPIELTDLDQHIEQYTLHTTHAKHVLEHLCRKYNEQVMLIRMYTHQFDQGYSWDSDIIGICEKRFLRPTAKTEFIFPMSHAFVREKNEYRQDVFGKHTKKQPFVGSFMYACKSDTSLLTVKLKQPPILVENTPNATAQILEQIEHRYTNPVIECITDAQLVYPTSYKIGHELFRRDTDLETIIELLRRYTP